MKKEMSWKQRVRGDELCQIENETGGIFLISGEDLNYEPIYCYLYVSLKRYDEFEAALNLLDRDFCPEDFGDILFEGKGCFPSEKIKNMMTEKFLCQHDFEENVKNFINLLNEEIEYL